jgi:flagellar hook assembly protein FlgD
LRSTSNISFNLTADASVELTVVDAVTGVLMAYKKYDDLLAGLNTIEWDGRNSGGEFIAPGKFTLGVRAVDKTGFRSLTQYTLQRIYY